MSLEPVSLLWERTQALISIIVVVTNMGVAVYRVVHGSSMAEYPPALSSALFLIIGFYFNRVRNGSSKE